VIPHSGYFSNNPLPQKQLITHLWQISPILQIKHGQSPRGVSEFVNFGNRLLTSVTTFLQMNRGGEQVQLVWHCFLINFSFGWSSGINPERLN
jgi:hypothetical protein